MSKKPNFFQAFRKKQNETLDVDPINVPLMGLPAEMDGYRIAVLADPHIQGLTEYHEKIVQAVQEAAPDFIVIAGDVIDRNSMLIESYTPFFEAIGRIAPTVAILGNNDCLPGLISTLRGMYKKANITLLENETRMLATRGVPLRVTGLIDPRAEENGIKLEHSAETHAYVPLAETLPPDKQAQGEFIHSILLIHQPNLIGPYLQLQPSLIICGHAHGGQFRVPGIGGLYAPGQGVFPRHTSGLYTLGNTYLVVSRGLGTHHLHLRLNNRPHIPLIILRSGPDAV